VEAGRSVGCTQELTRSLLGRTRGCVRKTRVSPPRLARRQLSARQLDERDLHLGSPVQGPRAPLAFPCLLALALQTRLDIRGRWANARPRGAAWGCLEAPRDRPLYGTLEPFHRSCQVVRSRSGQFLESEPVPDSTKAFTLAPVTSTDKAECTGRFRVADSLG
jgi:hypothetical protein